MLHETSIEHSMAIQPSTSPPAGHLPCFDTRDTDEHEGNTAGHLETILALIEQLKFGGVALVT